MSVYLKVKLSSLAAESRLIRREERRRKRPDPRPFQIRHGDNWAEPYAEALRRWREDEPAQRERASLYHHRVGVVRPEARATIIAYGFLRGAAYRDIEANPRTPPDWGKVHGIVKRYGPPGAADLVGKWAAVQPVAA